MKMGFTGAAAQKSASSIFLSLQLGNKIPPKPLFSMVIYAVQKDA